MRGRPGRGLGRGWRRRRRGVAGDGVVGGEYAVHDAVPFGEAGFDHHLHPDQQFVVSGGQQQAVKGEVGDDGGRRVGGGGHLGEAGVQARQVLVGTPDGG